MLEVLEEAAAVAPSKVLLVEDHEYSRSALTSLLKARGYKVVAADSGRGAIVEARRGQVGVVLMDIALDDEIDGIEAAAQIQQEQPLTSFIFVTAHSEDPEYRLRVQASSIRLGGWVAKPFEIDDLVELIEKEQRKLEILFDLSGARARGVEPLAYLLARADIDRTLSHGTLAELLGELEVESPASSCPGTPSGGPDEMSLAAVGIEIDTLYDQIRSLLESVANPQSRREAVRPLRARLEELEEIEADLLEEHSRAQMRFDPDHALRAEARMRELLDQK